MTASTRRPTKIVVTGATGFAGQALCAHLSEQGHYDVVALTRRPDTRPWPRGVREAMVGDLARADVLPALQEAFSGASAVVHLAVDKTSHDDANTAAFDANVAGFRAVATAAVGARVPRLVLLSSAHVAGTITRGTVISGETVPAPFDGYGRSKTVNEADAPRLTRGTATAFTIIRPPLVYGAGCAGTLRQLARAVQKGWPLPLGSVRDNRRDMIGVRNLAHFIELAATHPAAANLTFTVSDGAPVSTRGLVEALAKAAGTTPRLLPVPPGLLQAGLRLAGQQRAVERLLGDFVIDDDLARRRLGWVAPLPFAADIERLMAGLSR